MNALKIGILRGGNLNHDFSLRYGKEILNTLPENYFKNDIYISKKGDWFLNGRINWPEKIFQSSDVFLNTIKGDRAHKILEYFNAPCAGTDFFHSSLALNRVLVSNRLASYGLNTPKILSIDLSKGSLGAGREVFNSMPPFCAIKPVFSYIEFKPVQIRSFDFLINGIQQFINAGFDRIAVEQEILGKKAVCGVIENYRNQDYYALPVAEIIPFCKYRKTERYECPARFDLGLKRKIEELAIEAHKALGCKHYSEFVFAITPQNKIYVLETRIRIPQRESIFSKALNVIGSSYYDFLNYIIDFSLNKK